jgi:hypothetical protein
MTADELRAALAWWEQESIKAWEIIDDEFHWSAAQSEETREDQARIREIASAVRALLDRVSCLT